MPKNKKKVSDLPADADLGKVKLKLPLAFYRKMKDYCGAERTMYIVSHTTIAFFSPDPPGSKSRRLYPVWPGWDIREILGWEVVE